MVERLVAVDAGRLRDLLLSLGHSAASTGWAVRRLQEIQHSGRITGDAWSRGFGNATGVDSAELAAYAPRRDRGELSGRGS